MATFTFNVPTGFLEGVFLTYPRVVIAYFRNLKDYLVWLSFPLLIIALPFYIAYVVVFGVFWILSLPQKEDLIDQIDSTALAYFVAILQIVLYIPSIAFIFIAYLPAIILAFIVTGISWVGIKLEDKRLF